MSGCFAAQHFSSQWCCRSSLRAVNGDRCLGVCCSLLCLPELPLFVGRAHGTLVSPSACRSCKSPFFQTRGSPLSGSSYVAQDLRTFGQWSESETSRVLRFRVWGLRMFWSQIRPSCAVFRILCRPEPQTPSTPYNEKLASLIFHTKGRHMKPPKPQPNHRPRVSMTQGA